MGLVPLSRTPTMENGLGYSISCLTTFTAPQIEEYAAETRGKGDAT
jgi:hypothetical protein